MNEECALLAVVRVLSGSGLAKDRTRRRRT
jgi:hypothetical protein